MKLIFWITGGLSIGLGALLMIGAFGPTGFGLGSGDDIVPAAISYKSYGYDASLDLALTSTGMYGIPLILIGMALMIYVNASAWKDTNNEY
jgi:hypothetical protein